MKTAFTVLPGETSGAAMLTTPADTAFLTAAVKKEVRTKELSAREIMLRSSRADMPNQRPGVRIHTLHP